MKDSHSGDVEELVDWKDPIYDELKLNPFWWIVELIHHGRGRKIPMGNEGNSLKVQCEHAEGGKVS